MWCGDVDESLIKYDKAHEWFTDYFDSELVIVYKDEHLRNTM